MRKVGLVLLAFDGKGGFFVFFFRLLLHNIEISVALDEYGAILVSRSLVFLLLFCRIVLYGNA